jgi:hypothetical protein
MRDLTAANASLVLALGADDRADAFATLATAVVRALLVPSIFLGEAENSAGVARTLEATKGSLEGLVATDLDLDRHMDTGGLECLACLAVDVTG